MSKAIALLLTHCCTLLCMQVITSAEFHPQHCNIFAYSSSKGCIRLADMRNSALCDRHAKAFEEVDSSVSSSWASTRATGGTAAAAAQRHIVYSRGRTAVA